MAPDLCGMVNCGWGKTAADVGNRSSMPIAISRWGAAFFIPADVFDLRRYDEHG